MNPDWMPSSTEFQCLLAVETIINFMIRGKPNRGFPSLLIRTLGLSNPYFTSTDGYYLASWPFENLRLVEGRGLTFHPPETVSKLLPYLNTGALNRQCVNLLNCRKKFLETKRNFSYCGRFIMQPYVDKLATCLFRLMLTTVAKVRFPGTTGENCKLEHAFAGGRPASLLFTTPTNFWEDILINNGRPRSADSNYTQLFDLCVHLINETDDCSNDLKTGFVSCANKAMFQEGYPLRFSYNRHTEYIIIADNFAVQGSKNHTRIILKALRLYAGADYLKTNLSTPNLDALSGWILAVCRKLTRQGQIEETVMTELMHTTRFLIVEGKWPEKPKPRTTFVEAFQEQFGKISYIH